MENTVRREGYLELLADGKCKNDVVKVITGMRFTGKTTLLKQYIDDLLSSGVPEGDIFYFDFNNPSEFVSKYSDFDTWIRTYIALDKQKYVFIDEIQNIVGWENPVRIMLSLGNCDIYVSSWDRGVLSSSLFREPNVNFREIVVTPFSFKEYYGLYPMGSVEESFDKYIRYGSMHYIEPANGDDFMIRALGGIVNTCLINYLIYYNERFDIRQVSAVTMALYSNVGKIIDSNLISSNIGIPKQTVESIISELLRNGLVCYVGRYDFSNKRMAGVNGTYYVSDLGFRNGYRYEPLKFDEQGTLMNAVYLELVRRGYVVATTNIVENGIDFVVFKDDEKMCIQVCTTCEGTDAYSQKISTLKMVDDGCKKLILTGKRPIIDNDGAVEAKYIVDWMLE